MDWPAGWQARWIWAPPARTGMPVPLLGDLRSPPDAWNRFCFLRRAFDLDEVPDRVTARASADSRFVLHVNGGEVMRGPSRSVPERLTFGEADLAPHLREGANVIGVIARFYGRAVAWWRPAVPLGQLGFGSFVFEAPAIGVASDASWRGRAAPYARDPGGDPFYPAPEVVDGADWPFGWLDTGFDDSGWAPAAELEAGWFANDRTAVPAEPFPVLEADRIAPLCTLPVELDVVDAGRAVFDAGGIVLGTPWVEVEADAGSAVEILVGEELDENGLPVREPRNWLLRYEPAGEGRERIEAFDSVGFRYLTVRSEGRVAVAAVGATERRYPTSAGAAFSCDDDRLNRIWETGARTLEVCSTDAFLDCPGREQRAWVGDSYVHALVTYVTNADWRLAARNLRLGASSVRPDGLLTMTSTGDLSCVPVTIPDYSLHWLRALVRYHERTADAELVRDLLPVAFGVVEAFERFRGEDGLLHGVPGWVFVDWAMTQRSEVTGVVDALHAAALGDLVGLLEAAADGYRVDQIRALRERAVAGFEALWDPVRHVYVDAMSGGARLDRVSQHTNAMAILSGCAPEERRNAILEAVLDPERVVVTPTIGDLGPVAGGLLQWADPSDHCDFDPARHVVGAQPFFSHFVHQAVVTAGRPELIPDLCLGWWDMVEAGDGTFWEFWKAPPGFASRAHAWSATPTYDLTTHVLGVRPSAPGCEVVEVDPCLGRLRRASGRVPTPHGFLEADISRDEIRVTVPDGMSVRIRPPGPGPGPGPELMSLGPGSHVLHATA